MPYLSCYLKIVTVNVYIHSATYVVVINSKLSYIYSSSKTIYKTARNLPANSRNLANVLTYMQLFCI